MARKRDPKKPAPIPGRLVPQPHGGALQQGGSPGRPPSEIRKRLQGSFAERIPILEEFADGTITLTLRYKCPECGHEPADKSATPIAEILKQAVYARDRLKAIELLGKFGRIDQDGPSWVEVKQRLEATVEAIWKLVNDQELRESLLAHLSEIWRSKRPSS